MNSSEGLRHLRSSKYKRLEVLERSQQPDFRMPLVVQQIGQSAEEAILQHQKEHPDEEEEQEYFILQVVAAPDKELQKAYRQSLPPNSGMSIAGTPAFEYGMDYIYRKTEKFGGGSPGCSR